MSFAALAWAGKCKPGSASRKLVLLGLADLHNDEVNGAYPSVAWLVEFTDLNRKTVINCLADLEASGHISDSGERRGETKQIKLYRLNMETVPETEQFQKRNSSKKGAKESQKRDTDTVRTGLPKKDKPSLGKRPRKADSFPAPEGVEETVWRDFLSSPKRRKAGMNDTAYSGIKNNLAHLAEHGFPPGEMIALAVERGWTTVKLDWVQNDGRYQRTNGMAGNHRSTGSASGMGRTIDAAQRFVARGGSV